MSRSTLRLTGVAVAAVGAMAVGGTALAAPGGSTGPSSSDAPYLVRHVPGVTLTSLLTCGDSVGGYRMAGTPDGLGAYDNGDGTFTVLVNHEFGAGVSVPRSHGNSSGAFVSRWVVDSTTLKVLSGRDQITSLVTTGSLNLDRLCSADLAPVSAWYNAASPVSATTVGCSPTARSRPRTGEPSRTSSTPGSATSSPPSARPAGRTSPATPPPATAPSSSARATVAPRTSTCTPAPSRRPARRSSGPA